MKLFNFTRNAPVAENILVADTFVKKINGLAGLNISASLFLETRWGIHTFGMKIPIDCVVCDDKFIVRFIRKSVPASRLVFWAPCYKNVFELPAGTMDASGTEVGDTLQLDI